MYVTVCNCCQQDLGYAPDFVSSSMRLTLKEIKRQGIRVISNAGGVNPEGCADALKKVARQLGVDLKVATITGDNMMNLVVRHWIQYPLYSYKYTK